MSIEIIFGQQLRKIREENKLSQEELAFRAKLDRTYISLLERGKRRPTLNTIFALTQQLNISAAEMVRLVEEQVLNFHH
ncbi:helix-turn-helix domain-containing protein [Cohnella silvisoli]|uniref:Helix-turn-helix transcriptional regulator n=1 Tax=Cohnella silvisoli TaxID=2873699 RepID=A0ABV1KQG5_9BACL|nr:helix-turn-helix transcriptional regulator [Cohnella silvisoli]MCD9022003.1 helix-turn-helix domain-containing protein [Cohnella silvisoli]